MAEDAFHACPGGCGLPVVRNMLSCRECWFRLPGHLRAGLQLAYPRRKQDPRAHREALAACLSWYRDNPRVREV